MKTKTMILSSVLLIGACGGGNDLQQLEVRSYPSFSLGSPAPGYYNLTPEVRGENDYIIKPQKCIAISGIAWEWGTHYKITVEPATLPGLIGDPLYNCGDDYPKYQLVTVDAVYQDPLGTRYYNGVGNTEGGLYLFQPNKSVPAKLWGYYGGNFYCPPDLCDPLLGESTKVAIPEDYAFELMEIDGERVIGLIKL